MLATEKDMFIVAIGASAGGLQAIKEYFKHKLQLSGEAYVIILHSLRNYKSHLVSILAGVTGIRAAEIEDGLVVESNQIFVCPPSHTLDIRNGVFRLSLRPESEKINFTINHFFKSLAQDAQSNAVGIIMSGTGTDGTEGAHEIEQMGGVVIVQDPDTAQFDGMPMTIIRYDHPDYISAPHEMPALVESIVNRSEQKNDRKLRSLSSYYNR